MVSGITNLRAVIIFISDSQPQAASSSNIFVTKIFSDLTGFIILNCYSFGSMQPAFP